MLVNLAAVHTSSNVRPGSTLVCQRDITKQCTRQTITHALYDLAVNPQWFKPLREEIDPIIAAEGWTKSAIGKMNKVDSMLKEVLRFHGIGVGTLASVD